MDMRVIRSVCLVMLMSCLAAGAIGAEPPVPNPDGLRVLHGGYPRAYFFRAAEGLANRLPYERWDATFSHLMGIEGKVLNEELPGLPNNLAFFTRFKQAHPDQLVMLHFNGNARDPRWRSEKFFAGHWLYHNGAKVLEDVPAGEGEMDLRVDQPGLFRVNMGRYQASNEDIGLCFLDAAGRPDWRESEQVQLVSVDAAAKTIRVRRGCYGTRPRAFAAGRAYAAAHATEGPWGKQSHLLWFYNYSTRSPRDAAGRTCADMLAGELAGLFGPGGDLAAFDGLEFDVLHWRPGGGGGKRGLDCDADGQADGGVFDGVNTYGVGVVEFCRQLRGKLGERRLLLADGMGTQNQRAFGLLNGIESEGWPTLSDWEARDWSGGLNRHFFWSRAARPPVFNYVNHKFITRGEQPGVQKAPDVPWSIHRLVFAAAVMTDAAVCYSFAPPREDGEELGVWDELREGTAWRVGWLGRPLAPPVRLAARQPDTLAGTGAAPGKALLGRLSGDGVRFEAAGDAVKVSAAGPGQGELRFRLAGVPCDGPDLFVSVTARGEPMRGCPREVARMMWVGIAGAPGRESAAPPGQAPAALSMTPRAAGEKGTAPSSARFMTWMGDADFASGFYFSDVAAKSVDLEFTVEGTEPVFITRLSAHAHADAMLRDFERGVVVVNPSPRPYTFDLAALAPGQALRRLQGSAHQDPKTNDGSAVGAKVTLGPKDALFLVKVGQ